MPPITLEHAALALAVLGMALNAWVLWRIRVRKLEYRVINLGPNEALQFSAFLPPDLREHLSLAGGRSAAPSESAAVDVPKDVGVGSNANYRPGLEPVRKVGALQEICNHCGACLGSPAGVERNFVDGHRQIAGVDDLDRSGPHVGARHVEHHESHLEPNGVLSDQPHGVEHAERSAQYRNP